jgi:hypothetical protein
MFWRRPPARAEQPSISDERYLWIRALLSNDHREGDDALARLLEEAPSEADLPSLFYVLDNGFSLSRDRAIRVMNQIPGARVNQILLRAI